MLLVAKIKSGAPGIPENATVMLEVDLPQLTGRLDAEAIAARYSVSVKTVGRWHEEQIIPSFKIGSHIYCAGNDLDAFESRLKNQVQALTVKQIPFPIRQAALASNSIPATRNERKAA